LSFAGFPVPPGPLAEADEVEAGVGDAGDVVGVLRRRPVFGVIADAVVESVEPRMG
jgi:hypothetical protein